MKATEAWKNFNLGDELSISGVFIYNGVRRFYEMKTLDRTDEIFEVLYNLSVGLERLLKIAVVLLEHDDADDQGKLERSLMTHNHLDLLGRIRVKAAVKLGDVHIEFLALLGTFYKSLRYDRFSLGSVYDSRKEKDAICALLEKHLKIDASQPSAFFGISNDLRYRSFVRRTVSKISSELYRVVRQRSSALNLYTYELRHGSKAETVFLGESDIDTEEVLWKELLVFFMNTPATSGYLEFLRRIEPLEFDPELTGDYLECFRSDAAAGFVVDELEHHYEELADKRSRLEVMDLIGNPNAQFDSLDSDDEDDDVDNVGGT